VFQRFPVGRLLACMRTSFRQNPVSSAGQPPCALADGHPPKVLDAAMDLVKVLASFGISVSGPRTNANGLYADLKPVLMLSVGEM
jgi:hypothetical protein